MAGGTLTLGVPAEDYPSVYRLFDASGRALEPDEMPAVRAARGERLEHVQVDWETPRGLRTVLVSGSTIASAAGAEVTVMTFEDVTALEGARRRSSLLADELRVDARQRRRRDHRAVAGPQADLRQRGGRALLRHPAGTGAGPVRRRDLPARASRRRTELGRPLDLARLPGRLALAGLSPEPVTIRSRDLATGEIRWARIKATAVHDPDGGVRLAINVIEDITELKRSEEAQRFLAEASRRLSGSSLDYELTLRGGDRAGGADLADRVSGRCSSTSTARRARGGRGDADGRGVARARADDRADDRAGG